MIPNLSIVEADFSRSDHQASVLALLDASSADPSGNGGPLPSDTRARLIPRLRDQPVFLTLLARLGDEPAGIAICFRGQSHAAGQPLFYISDFFVPPAYRRHGIARLLLEAIERKARALACCRLVLEVQETNLPAWHLYQSAGFTPSPSPTATGSLSLVKQLDSTQ